MDRGTIAATGKRWSVVALGVCFLVVAGQHLVTPLVVVDLIEASIPVSASLVLVALGGWLATDDAPPTQVWSVCHWCVGGSAVLGLTTGWVAFLQRLQGNPLVDPGVLGLTNATLGAFAGGVLGLYYARLREQTAELERQKDRLDEFAGIVSHDLRNPINVAQGHLELARANGATEHFETVERAHDRMERLIREVLSLARRGDTVEEQTPVALRAVATRAWETVETDAATVRVETDQRILSDGTRLRALFENLFRNAVEHGSDSVTVVVGDLDGGGDGDGFYVADDGPGVDPAVRDRVFEGGFSTRRDGTGFGLAIVERITDAHGWQVAVSESASGGARFEFTGVRHV